MTAERCLQSPPPPPPSSGSGPGTSSTSRSRSVPRAPSPVPRHNPVRRATGHDNPRRQFPGIRGSIPPPESHPRLVGREDPRQRAASRAESVVLSLLVAALGSRSLVRTRRELALENLALRQQLAILRRARPKRLPLKGADRIFWAWLSSLWTHWADVLVIVRPDTVVRWHRRAFRLFWGWRSRRQGPGRPPASNDIRDLIRRMATENLGWGAPRIHGELLKIGIDDSERTVSRLRPRRHNSPSQTGVRFLPTTPAGSPASTSSPCPPRPSASSMSSWCFRSTDAGSCTGT
jgi:hypothetical protein